MIQPSFTLGVLGAVRRDNRILLVRTEYAGMRWQLPGGYVEPGESLEHALRREIREELGVDLSILDGVGTYVREFDRNVATVFLIDIPTEDVRVDDYEVREAEFFAVDELPGEISPRTRRIVEDVLGGHRSPVIIFGSPTDSGWSPGVHTMDK